MNPQGPPRARATLRSQPPSTPGGRAIEVAAIDANVILVDACLAILAGKTSALLDIIDAGVAAAVMSDQAFREVGWKSASAARFHKLDHDGLRAVITADYLPRIPVVTVPPHGHWMPEVTDVLDPDDVPHVQVARLIGGTAVLSHDKDLRKPGHAPRNRDAYEQRLGTLHVLSSYRQVEDGAGMVLAMLGAGADHAVTRASTALGVRRLFAWPFLLVGIAAATSWGLSTPARRARVAEALEPVLTKIGEATAQATAAHNTLTNARLLTPSDSERLEVRVASYLARTPDRNIGDIASELQLTSREQAGLSTLLRQHPAFEKVSGWGWAVGRPRQVLETIPRPNTRGTPQDSAPTVPG